MSKRFMALVAAGLTVSAGYAMANPPKLDPALPAYTAVSGVSGNVSSIGSDTLNNLMTLWAETFSKFYPNAKIQIEGRARPRRRRRSSPALPSSGRCRAQMKGTEVDDFEKKYGYKPTPIRTSVDALAVFVNKDNPIKCLTLAQVDAIFSKIPTLRRQGRHHDLGAARTHGRVGEQADQPVWPQLGLGHLRVLQGARAEER